MRNYSIGLIGIFIVTALTSCSSAKSLDQRLQSIDVNSIKIEKKENALDFVKEYFDHCDYKKIPEVTFSKEMISFFENKGSEFCADIAQTNGALEEVVLEQLRGNGHSVIMYRFKVQFENLDKPSEIRLAENYLGKYIGLGVKKTWNNTMIELKQYSLE